MTGDFPHPKNFPRPEGPGNGSLSNILLMVLFLALATLTGWALLYAVRFIYETFIAR